MGLLFDDPQGAGRDLHHAARLAGGAPLVLPAIPQDVLEDALRRLPRDELDLALREKIITLVNMPGLRLYAACGREAIERAQARGCRLVACASPETFHAAIHNTHGQSLLRDATHWLARQRPEQSASRRLTPAQIISALAALALLAGLAISLPWPLFWAGLSTLGALFFLSVIALRVLCLLPKGSAAPPPRRPVSADALPVYSVLVPVFRETAVLRQLLRALRKLDYPALGSKRTKTARRARSIMGHARTSSHQHARHKAP